MEEKLKDHNFRVAVLIVAYNAAAQLKESLKCINWMRDSKRFEVFLVDNSDKEETGNLINKDFNWINYINSETNLGFAKGMDLAYEVSDKEYYDYYLVLNPDLQIDQETIIELISAIQKEKSLGIVAPKLESHSGIIEKSILKRLNSVRIIGNDIFKSLPLTNPFSLDSYSNNSKLVEAVSGACMLIKKEVIEKVGFFDTDYFMYYEDLDFCNRVKENGYQIKYISDLTAIHSVSSSSEEMDNKDLWRYKAITKSRLQYLDKNGSMLDYYITKFYSVIYAVIKSFTASKPEIRGEFLKDLIQKY
jgi:hypothetical protein